MESEELRVVAEFASLAPSVHNTQPWRFVGDPGTLEVHLDPARLLAFLDPDGRQMRMSCGAAIEFARLAVRSLGRACTVRLLPDPSNPTVVGKLVIGETEPVTPNEQRMIDAVARRYTDRGPYTDEPVSPDVLQRLREAAGERRCWLRVIDQPDQRLSVIRLLANAESTESGEANYRDELAKWRRSAPAPDGVPVEAAALWDQQQRVSDVPLRDFGGDDRHPHPGAGLPPTVERDSVILIGTDRDDAMSWLQAGRAVADVLLVLTDADLVSQPLGPVLDLPTTRAQLRRELGLVGYPQLLLRVGHGQREPVTHRRTVDDVFTEATSP
ncbi:MAG TPA: nitroreductase family protein [Mycobacteriales bacterium]|nr:nitroreductase family protein [Mycobacteriales bacterium]HWC34166.1 nitroreductase family protein [Mycobacteriales bacterium]